MLLDPNVLNISALFFVFLLCGCGQSELHGDNVCEVIEEKEDMIFVKEEQNIILATYELCKDITRGFRCKVEKKGTKIHYKQVPNKTKVKLTQCCYGYYPTENDTCIICEEGFYGVNCSSECVNCTADQICHHTRGCCDINVCSPSADSLYQLPVEKGNGNQWMISILIASICVAVILLLGLIFYRKKYMKERDPDLPTLTYHPNVKGYIPPVDESREFNNPLYRQSAVDLATAKAVDAEYEVATKKTTVGNEPQQNVYESLDEVNEELRAGPSSRAPLMHDTQAVPNPMNIA